MLCPARPVRSVVDERAGPVREHHCLNPVAQIEFLEDVRDVCLHGRFADVQLARDLPIGQTAGDQAKDRTFGR